MVCSISVRAYKFMHARHSREPYLHPSELDLSDLDMINSRKSIFKPVVVFSCDSILLQLQYSDLIVFKSCDSHQNHFISIV